MKLFSTCCLATLFLLVSCAPPEIEKVKNDDTPAPEDTPVVEGKPDPKVDSPKVDEKPQVAPEPPEEHPGEPYLIATGTPTSITLGGAIKSRVQKRDMLKFLNEAFPDIEIIDEMTIDARMRTSAWGNRVGDALLVPYFKLIPDGSVQFKDNVVKLTGHVENPQDFQTIMRTVIDIFSGDAPDDIDFSEMTGATNGGRGKGAGKGG